MKKILVVGAGPVGLTAAIELTRLGFAINIIEQKPTREIISRAIGINSRSLELLEAADVTPRLLKAGVHIQSTHMHYGQRELVLQLKDIPHHYNFLLALPQDETEAILETRLNELNVKVQRQTQLLDLQQHDQQVTVQTLYQEQQQTSIYDFVIGADGAHSITRKLIDQPFNGTKYPEIWTLADVHMDWPYDHASAHAFLGPHGSIGGVIPLGGDRYRVIANHGDTFDLLPQPYTIHKIVWQSDFSISCRIVDNYQQGHVFLAGDAAHIHTPVGGRGMNLGIEDACILAQLLATNRWQEYNTLRHPIGEKVVHSTYQMQKVLTAKNPIAIFCRNWLLFPLLQLRSFQKRQLQEMVGI